MHTYLRAIGFSNLKNKKELSQILQDVINSYDEKIVVDEGEGHVFGEMSKTFGYDMGITVCGTYNEKDEFEVEYYYPYFRGTGISSEEDILIEQHLEKESFSGACDDVRVGVTLIFYLSNVGTYLNQKYKGVLQHARTTLTLSGLSSEGKILLPIKKDVQQVENERKKTTKRTELIGEARKGNEEAMESLTMEDMDTYSLISRRIQQEDILSIVDTYFMPYGMECDRYHVMGEILEVAEVENIVTKETMYQLSINCNDIPFDICINKKDLFGEPKVGRRFKGVIWLQGVLNF